MPTRPPTTAERELWTLFRLRCLQSGNPDPGEAPEQWPADPQDAQRIAAILRSLSPDPARPERAELQALFDKP